MVYMLGLFYRSGLTAVIISAIIGGIALASLIVFNSIVPLPLNAQRALCFLPGDWDSRVVIDASNSTDWRVEMWKAALLTPNWIENKTFGDGLGMSRQEIQWIGSLNPNQMNDSA